MKTIQLTWEQSAAVKTDGRPLLISAAAGSGKTFVLVQRLMERICSPDAPADISDFLIITYTRAAASELKAKIQDALYSAIAETSLRDAGKLRHLKRQTLLMQKSHISTIHGFCSAIIKEHADVLGIRTDFRILEPTEDTELKEIILDRVLDAAYAAADQDPGFLDLTELLTNSTSDRRLKKTVLDIYESLQSIPFPDQWISRQADMLSSADTSGFGSTVWGRSLLGNSRGAALWCAGTLRDVCRLLSSAPEPPEKWIEGLNDSVSQIENFAELCAEGWGAASEADVQFPRTPRGGEKNFPLEKAMIDTVKAVIGQALEIFSQNDEDAVRDLSASAPAILRLYRLVREFDSLYSDEKRISGRMTYSDLEHLTLRLFRSPESDAFTDIAEAVSGRFREVLVDEYQDINPVQEMIVQAVSGLGERLFCVGDMKQSIYRFRQSDVSIFKRKYDEYPDYAGQDGDGPFRILLSQNFRSSRGIVDGINSVFSSVMSDELGDISYGESERLRLGRNSPETQAPCCELLVADGSESSSADEYRRNEAFSVAWQIHHMVTGGELIPDGSVPADDGGEGLRTLAYDDFAVLFRSMSQSEAYYKEAFEYYGIPYNSVQQDPWFDSEEVVLLLDYLTVINNPHQDIPLMHVLTSPLYRFSFDLLTDIRTTAQAEDLYSAVLAFGDSAPECRLFLDHLSEFRQAARYMTTDTLLRLVLKKTDAAILLGQSQENAAAGENIGSLLRYAESFESRSFQGLYRFDLRVRYLRESGKKPDNRDASGGGGVSLVTIHRSKGLEYPVVFIGDTSRPFNQRDEQEPVLFHRELGAGLYVLDAKRRIRYPSASRAAIRQRLNREMLSEEMRILYVALTRAKDRLIIPVYTKRSQSLLRSAGILGPFLLETPVLSSRRNLQDWLLSAILQDPQLLNAMEDPDIGLSQGYPWRIRRVTAPSDQVPAEQPVQPSADRPDLTPGENEVREIIGYRYPYASDFGIPTKITATELKGTVASAECLEEASAAGRHRPHLRRPDLDGGEQRPDGREKGTAMHCAMQYLDYACCGREDELEEEITRLVFARFLSQSQADSLDRSAILKLFSGPLGERILSADRINREFKFSLLTPARVLLGGDSEEQVLFQGAVDCWWETDGEITVVDFKTDRIAEGELEHVTDRYRRQVELYAYALERITGLPVTQASLYFFSIGREIPIIQK